MINLYKLSDKEFLERIGNGFKNMRLLMDISQKKLSEITGVSRSSLIRFEKGEPISMLYLIKIFRAIRRLEDIDKVFLVPGFTHEEMKIIAKKERKRASRSS